MSKIEKELNEDENKIIKNEFKKIIKKEEFVSVGSKMEII